MLLPEITARSRGLHVPATGVPERTSGNWRHHVIQSSVDVTFRSANNEFRRATSVKSEPRPIILKLVLDLDLEKLVQFVGRLRRMNVNSAVLFPGLDGFARSLGEQLIHFRELATGGPPGTMQR
jgi:hypothetical protein